MQSNPVPVLVADAPNNFPIMAKTTPANREMTEQNIRDIVEPPIAEPSGHSEPLAEIGYPPQSKVETPRENPSDSVELSTINIVDNATGQPIEHLDSDTGPGSTHSPFHPTPFPSEDVPWSLRSDRPYVLRSDHPYAFTRHPPGPPTPYPGHTPPSFWSKLPDEVTSPGPEII